VVKMQYFVRFMFPGSAETDSKWGGKLNSRLMASCIRNIRTKTY